MNKNFFVYVLGSEGQGAFRTYVGWTNNLDQRLIKHNDGRGARFTRGKKWRLLYAEQYSSQSAAMSREWQLKRDRNFRNEIRSLCPQTWEL